MGPDGTETGHTKTVSHYGFGTYNVDTMKDHLPTSRGSAKLKS